MLIVMPSVVHAFGHEIRVTWHVCASLLARDARHAIVKINIRVNGDVIESDSQGESMNRVPDPHPQSLAATQLAPQSRPLVILSES